MKQRYLLFLVIITAFFWFSKLNAQIVISEIMYNPPESGTDSLEYIELYNRGNVTLNLQDYTFSQGVTYTFGNINLNSGEYFVLAGSSSKIDNLFGVGTADDQWTAGALTNVGETIELLDNLGNQVDIVTYDNIAPWPLNAAGLGNSIKLCDAFSDNSDPVNWMDSTEGIGIFVNGLEIKGSPGTAGICTFIPATHLNFDGVNDYIQLPNESSFDFTNQMTVEFWMNSNVNPEQWDALVVKGDDSWRVALTATGTIAFAGTNAFTDFYSTTSVTDGNWHHIAATYDGANAKIYIDGVLENQLAGTANINNSTYNVTLGENSQMTGRYYSGNMDEVRIWNVARTEVQINASKNCELQGVESGLVAYYQCNQGVDQDDNTAITTLNDATSNANNGTLTNFALSGVTSNWLAGSPVTTGSTIPSAPTVSNQTFCAASTVNDLVPAPIATINWYNAATSTTVLNSTDALTTGTYYVTNVNSAGCESDRVAVNVTVSNFTVTITSQNNVSCYGGNDGSVSLSVSGGVAPYSILWDDGTAYAFTRNNLTAGNYRAWITDALGCTDYISGAGGTLVTITEPAQLTAPTVTSPVVYNEGDVAVPLTATSSGNGLLWYTTATGGTGSTTAPTPSTTTVGSTSYWVSSTSGASCESSSRSEIVVTVNAFTPAPTTTWSTQVYTGDDKDLTVLSVSGNSLKWYDAATGGNLLPSSTFLVDETTYYVSQTLGGLESTNRLAITVNRISENTQLLPTASTVTNLVATPTTGTTAQWYTTAIGGTPLASTDVLSNGTYYVEQFNGTSIETLGSGFSGPYRVAVQSDGKILIADTNNYAIKRMDADGTNIVTLASGFDTPTGVAVQADGKILIADFGNSAIKRMDADGTNIVTLGSGFNFPNGVVVQSDGKILIADTYNNVIKRMDADGTNIVTLGSGFYGPSGVAVQSDGKILIADTNNNVIKRMDADGTNIVTLGSGFVGPARVTVQADGKILITDTYNNAIKRMDADGTNIVTLGSGFNFPNGVAVQSDGKILVSDTGNNSIKRITEASTSNRVPVTIDVTTLSTSTFDENNFTIYPNPTKGLFTITTESKVKVEVNDITGRLVLIENIANTQTLSIENQAAGVYIVKVTSENAAIKSIKLIKE